MTNDIISQHLREYAAERDQGGGLFRARSYRAAAFAIARLQRPLLDIFRQGGRAALEAIPGIGISMAYTIEVLLTTGEFRVLREPGQGLTSLPGVGPRLAEALRDRLGVTTLEGLRQAARDGRLTRHVGRRRLQGIVTAAEARLREESSTLALDEPTVGDLVAFDTGFRNGVETQGRRAGWVMRAAPANTALAHRLGMTSDWVVIEFERGEVCGQRTVVTETQGDLAGQRVVRGREAECRRLRGGAAAA
ncbi:MAG: helix-hairpin-helix domain-containing protein [Gemmataceae bacterium]